MGDILGGDDGGVEQATTLTTGQRDLLDAITDLVTPQVGQGVDPYSGQTVASISPLQQSAFNSAYGLSNLGSLGINLAQSGISGYNPQQGYDILNTAQQGLQGAMQEFDPQTVMDALDPARRLALNTFNTETIPNLLERFGATSGGSGSLNTAFGDAAQELSLGLSAQAAPYLFQGQQNQLDRQLQGASIGSTLSQIPGTLGLQSLQIGGGSSDLLSTLANLGASERSLQQQFLTDEANRYYEAQPYNNPYLTGLAPLALGTRAFENVYTQPSPGLGSALLPALGSLGGAAIGGSALTAAAGNYQSAGSLFGGLFGF